jgi:hypothetical protein
LAFLLYEGGTIHNASEPIRLLCLLFLCRLRFSSIPTDKKSDLYEPTSNSCIFTPIENWTHVYMNLFTRNGPYCHLKYLHFLLKHLVYVDWTVCTVTLLRDVHVVILERSSLWVLDLRFFLTSLFAQRRLNGGRAWQQNYIAGYRLRHFTQTHWCRIDRTYC